MPQPSPHHLCDCADCLGVDPARLPVIDRPTSHSQQLIRGDRQQAFLVCHLSLPPQLLPPDSSSPFTRSILLITQFYEAFGFGLYSSPISNIVTVRPSTYEPSRSGRGNNIRSRVPILHISYWLPSTSHDGLTVAWICDMPQPSTSAYGRGNRGVLTCPNCN